MADQSKEKDSEETNFNAELEKSENLSSDERRHNRQSGLARWIGWDGAALWEDVQ